jgi:hypothetical protein
MTKKSENKERIVPSGKMTALRIDPKIRYLADLAAAATGDSLTKYIEGALLESFKRVTLRVAEKPEPFLDSAGNWQMPEPPDPTQERIQDEVKSIGNLADLLWSDSEYVRMLMLSMTAPHIQSDDDKALLAYVHGRKDLWTKSAGGSKPDRAKINEGWDSIKTDFAKSRKGGKA